MRLCGFDLFINQSNTNHQSNNTPGQLVAEELPDPSEARIGDLVRRMLNDQLRTLVQLIECNNFRLMYVSAIQLKGTILIIVGTILRKKLA